MMFVGGDNAGKTSLLFEIAKFHPDRKCILLDLENKAQKIRDVYFPEVDNVEIHNILNIHDHLIRVYNEVVKTTLVAGDWLLVDGLDKAWDMIQAEYDSSEHGPDMWKWCKGIHNKTFMDNACGRAPFNVAMTAWAAPNESINRERERDAEVKEDLLLWDQFGFRPGGEKRNTSRFDTVWALRTSARPGSSIDEHFVATFKDKGRPYFRGERKIWFPFEFPLFPQYVELINNAEGRVAELQTGYAI